MNAYVPREQYSAARVCPESPGRLTQANAAITAKSGTLIPLTRVLTAAEMQIAFVNEYEYDKHDSAMLLDLSTIFLDAHTGGSLMDKAEGSGMKLLTLLAARRDGATGLDRTVLVSRWTRHTLKGVVGPINYVNWSTFWEQHERLRLNV